MGFNKLAVVLVISCIVSQVSSRYLLDYWTNYWPVICPLNAPRQNCNANPCHVHKCPMRPNAVCEPNFCGGCKPDFFSKTGKVITLRECFDRSCKPDIPVPPLCKSLQCSKAKCDAHPDAVCLAGGCHSCIHFYKYGRRLLPHECEIKSNTIPKCPSTNKQCAQDPCRHAMCNTTSDTLICIPDYCKCSYKFVDEYSRPIQCRKPIYNPLDVKCQHYEGSQQCHDDPCKKDCKSDPEAICIDECGRCTASYFDKRGNRLDASEC